ncbi:MAG: hypothetical protein JJE48_01080, partial [Actinobacteria bacterium]|nr:hypothetical protein [Actinomycetota bacterium]
MAKNDWYLLSFILTVVAACFLWGLAIIVYRNNKKEYLNRTLALAMVFMGLWILSGFIDRIFENPSDIFVLWTFRWAYATGTMACTLLFLFALALYLDSPPKKWLVYAALGVGTASSLLSLSPYVVRSASYHDNVLQSQNGTLYPIVSIFIILPLLCSIYFIYAKWHRSTGIDRAKTTVVLLGISVFFPFVALCIFIFPHFVGNDISVSYAFLGSVIPVAATSYAIIRMRILDVRIILRRTGVFILGTIVVSIPIIMLFLLFRILNLNPFIENALTLI